MEFNRHRCQRAYALDRHTETVCKKSVQVGWTEIEMARAISYCAQGYTVFHMFPTLDVRNRFVQNRFDRTVAAVPYYELLMDEAREHTRGHRIPSDGITLKQIGRSAIYFVGANQKASMTEAPADAVLIDEYDRCSEEAIELARDRVGASPLQAFHVIGNPSLPNRGVSELYADSNQNVWHLKCESCREWQPLEWLINVAEYVGGGHYRLRAIDNGDGDVSPVCRKCGAVLDRYGFGEWVTKYPSRSMAGYEVSQMMCGAIKISRMWDYWLKAQGNSTRLQRFWNSLQGKEYATTEDVLTPEMLDRLIGTPRGPVPPGQTTVMGVDVGKSLHYWVLDPSRLVRTAGGLSGKGVVLDVGELRGPGAWDDLLAIQKRFSSFAVLDLYPETFQARAYRMRAGKNSVLLAQHVTSEGIEDVGKPDWDKGEIKYRLTPTMDASHAMLSRQLVIMPMKIKQLEDLYEHMTVVVRTWDPKKERSLWTSKSVAADKDSTKKPDHYRYAWNFTVIALTSRLSRGGNFVVGL